jgi:hypothetical protein
MLRGLASATIIEEVGAAGPAVGGDVVWWGVGRRTGLVGRHRNGARRSSHEEEACTTEESG